MQLGPAKLHATCMATCRQLQLEVIAINLYMWVGGVHKQKVVAAMTYIIGSLDM